MLGTFYGRLYGLWVVWDSLSRENIGCRLKQFCCVHLCDAGVRHSERRRGITGGGGLRSARFGLGLGDLCKDGCSLFD